MLKYGNKDFLNLQEQVYKNMKDIKDIQQGTTVLAEFGIKVVGQVDSSEDLPDPSTYEGDYGDAYIVGTEEPYEYYIFTRAFEGQEDPSWFDLGEFPVPGPQGPQGEQGPVGVTPIIDMTVNSVTTLNPGQSATVSITKIGTMTNPLFKINFGIPQGAQGVDGVNGAQGPTGPQGPQGPQGPKGDTGGLIEVVGIIASADNLPDPVTLDKLDAAYLVGTSSSNYHLYIQVGETTATALWTDVGLFNVGTVVTVGGDVVQTFDADTKLDKVSGNAENVVYAQTTSAPTTVVYKEAVGANTIPLRDSNGQIKVPATPTSSDHAASKNYVDTATASLLPTQHAGDLIVGTSTANVATRLAIGSAGQVLTVNSDANGLEYKTFNDVPSYLGADAGKTLKVNSLGTGLEWTTPTVSWSNVQSKPNFATVATSGSYNDLSDKPSIPAAQIQSDWTQSDNTKLDYIKNKPSLATVATSGSYEDLTDKPTIPDAVSGTYSDSNWTTITIGSTTKNIPTTTSIDWSNVTNKPTFATVATSGDYDDLIDKPNLATVATTGSYTDLIDKPSLATVATTGDYDDLTNKPTIPTVPVQDVTLGGTSVLSGTTASLPAYPVVPTNVSSFTNDIGYITASALSGYATETWVGNQGYLTSVSWSDVSGKPSFSTVATSGSYNDLSNKPTIPDAVSGTYSGSNWTTLTIGNTTKSIPQGGGGGGSVLDVIYIDSTTSTTSGTLTSTDLAKITDHPQSCVIRKYGSSAQYQQDYELTEIAYTNDTQETVNTYTYELVQNTSATVVRGRKITITASTGDWTFSSNQVTVPTINKYVTQTIRFIFTAFDGQTNTFNGAVTSNYGIKSTSGVQGNSSLSTTQLNTIAQRMAENFPSESDGSTAFKRYTAASGYYNDHINNKYYMVIGIAAWRDSSSSYGFYLVVCQITSSGIGAPTVKELPISSIDLPSSTAMYVANVG